jgi:hypothetical protein
MKWRNLHVHGIAVALDGVVEVAAFASGASAVVVTGVVAVAAAEVMVEIGIEIAAEIVELAVETVACSFQTREERYEA